MSAPDDLVERLASPFNACCFRDECKSALSAQSAEITRLRAALRECASRLESCAIIGGNSREVAALAVKKYCDLLARPTGT
jgi:hypothetical protein